MPFKLLKQVISHLRKQSKCPFCAATFTEESIFLLATSTANASGISNGLFFLVCPKCLAQAFVIVEVTNVTAQLKKENIKIRTAEPGKMGVSINEILDMHNFLKNWEGDVNELFSEK